MDVVCECGLWLWFVDVVCGCGLWQQRLGWRCEGIPVTNYDFPYEIEFYG